MDQGVFFEVGEFDKSKVDLQKTPTSVHEYLQQVVVDRERCPTVVSMESKIDPKTLKPARNQIAPELMDKVISCQWAPGKEWSTQMSNEFSLKRSQLEGRYRKIKKIPDLDLPQPECASKWRQICLEQRLPQVEIQPELESQFAHHTGTPPTLRFIMSLNDVEVQSLIQHLIAYFLEKGYSRALFEWLYSLLLVVDKPLIQDVVASLRSMARECRTVRSTLSQEDTVLINEHTLFIAIITLYFGQKDLAD